MIFGKHINRYYIKYAGILLIGLIALVAVDYLQLVVPNLYQMLIMLVVCALLWYPKRHTTTSFRWSWAIPFISLFICMADFAYYTSLSDPDSMISVVSLVRRSSVIISFICAALIFRERNLRAKALDLLLILIGMVLIWLGTAR